MILLVSYKITFLSREEILMKKSVKTEGNWLHPEVVDVDQTFFILILWNLEEARKCNLVFYFKELSQSQLHISTRFFVILSQINIFNACFSKTGSDYNTAARVVKFTGAPTSHVRSITLKTLSLQNNRRPKVRHLQL